MNRGNRVETAAQKFNTSPSKFKGSLLHSLKKQAQAARADHTFPIVSHFYLLFVVCVLHTVGLSGILLLFLG